MEKVADRVFTIPAEKVPQVDKWLKTHPCSLRGVPEKTAIGGRITGAVVLRKPMGSSVPLALPIISEAKPTKFDKRFCRRIHVEIREVPR